MATATITDPVIPAVDDHGQPSASDLSRIKKAQPYLDTYLAWAEANGVEKSAATLMAWDTEHNSDKSRNLFDVNDVIDASYKALFNRVFYQYFKLSLSVKPKTITTPGFVYEPADSEKTTQVVSAVQKGIFLPSADADQRKYLIAAAEDSIWRAANRLIGLKEAAQLKAVFANFLEVA